MAVATVSAIDRAANRIIDALERGDTPSAADLKTAKVCKSCYGYGYYYTSTERADADRRTKCKTCAGIGAAKL